MDQSKIDKFLSRIKRMPEKERDEFIDSLEIRAAHILKDYPKLRGAYPGYLDLTGCSGSYSGVKS